MTRSGGTARFHHAMCIQYTTAVTVFPAYYFVYANNIIIF